MTRSWVYTTDMSQNQDEITKLFSCIVKHFDEMDRRLDDTMSKDTGDRILILLDELHGKADIDDTERLAMTRQLDRHEDWTRQASVKLGVKYDPSMAA